MLYLDYVRYKRKYVEAQEVVSEILDEKAVLFQKTQPKSSISDSERVDGGSPVNKTEEYIIACERRHINERLSEAKDILFERLEMLIQKETELRQSQALFDRIYVMKYLDDRSVADIAEATNYSEPHLYRILRMIRRNARITKDDKK